MTATLTPADDGYRVEVQIVADSATLREQHRNAPADAAACTEPVGDGPVVARVTFCRGMITPETASHELFHAVLCWALRAEVSDWEDLAYAMGRMAGQLLTAIRRGTA